MIQRVYPHFTYFNIMSDIAGYRFIEFVHAANLGSFMSALGSRPENVHVDIFRYDKEAKEYWLAPNEKQNKKAKSIKKYRGDLVADDLIFDFDCDELEQSAEDAQTLVKLMKSQTMVSSTRTYAYSLVEEEVSISTFL